MSADPESPTAGERTDLDQELTQILERIIKEAVLSPSGAAGDAGSGASESDLSAGDLSMESVTRRFPQLGVVLRQLRATLHGELAGEIDRLAQVRREVAQATAELERLHKLDAASSTLEQLVQEHEAEKGKLAEEMSAQRRLWEDEKAQHEQNWREEAESRKKRIKQEQDEFEHIIAAEREQARRQFDEEMRLLVQENLEKQTALEKSWQAREASLLEREEKWNSLLGTLEEFSKRFRATAAAPTAGERCDSVQAQPPPPPRPENGKVSLEPVAAPSAASAAAAPAAAPAAAEQQLPPPPAAAPAGEESAGRPQAEEQEAVRRPAEERPAPARAAAPQKTRARQIGLLFDTQSNLTKGPASRRDSGESRGGSPAKRHGGYPAASKTVEELKAKMEHRGRMLEGIRRKLDEAKKRIGKKAPAPSESGSGTMG